MKKAQELINRMIDTNLKLEEKGVTPVSICLQAEAGIGKTSVVQQIAKDRGMQCIKLNLSQLEEVGDLIGYPQVEYECQVGKVVKDKEGKATIKVMPDTVWLNAKQMESSIPNIKYRQTGKTRMGYAKPSWAPEYDENGTIFLVDDFTRATSQLLNALMDLIWEHKYVSWSLPAKTTTVLTSNPDNGNYNVTAIDTAVSTRFLAYDVSFDIDSWMKWAEKRGVDGRCINFVAAYHESLFNTDDEGNSICNPRSFTMFSDAISDIKDWNSSDSLSLIKLIAKGCFKDEGDKFSNMFSAFIRSNMHQLVQPKDMLLGAWSTVKDTLEKTVYDGNTYRADIASLLERRFTNYVNVWLDGDGKTPIKTVQDRILNFIDNQKNGGKILFSKDLFYHMVKEITSDHKSQTNKLLFEPKIAKMIS